MRRSSNELKILARKALSGNYGIAVAGLLLVSMTNAMITMLTPHFFSGSGILSTVIGQIASFIISLLLSVLSTGYTYMVMNMCRQKEYSLMDLFYCFKHHPDKFIVVSFIMSLVVRICLLPLTIYSYLDESSLSAGVLFVLIIAMIIGLIVLTFVSLNFAFSEYLLLDDPNKKSFEVLKESCSLMKGNKGSLFYLYVSFLGLILLSVFSCFIGLLWIMPYIEAADIYFYMDRMDELNQTPAS